MTEREIALGNEILRSVVGSTTHGTAIEGQDDRDEMAVFIEPPENVCGPIYVGILAVLARGIFWNSPLELWPERGIWK